MRKSFALSVLLAGIVFAQDYRAKIQGIVTDSTDATVAGAKVTIQNLNTGIATSHTTGPNGAYLFDNVEPGTYLVSAEMQGFARQPHENVLVQTRADVTVNFTLRTGRHGGNDQRDGDGCRAAVQYHHARTDGRPQDADGIAGQGAQSVHAGAARSGCCQPLLRRNGTRSSCGPPRTIDVGGNTSQKNDLLIDGAPTQIGPKGSYSPPMDAVQEFSVQQNSVDAEFGHSAGGTLSVSTKSGTNEIHGTGYYFGRNPKFNALVNPTTRTPNFVRNHIWGGTAGGADQEEQSCSPSSRTKAGGPKSRGTPSAPCRPIWSEPAIFRSR